MRNFTLLLSVIFMAGTLGCAGLQKLATTETQPEVTSKPGPTIEEVLEYDPSWGGKKSIAVMDFEKKTSYRSGGAYDIGTGMADQLTTALFQTDAFIVLERQKIQDVLREQEFGASGRVKRQTAADIGKIEGAQLLIYGSITEYDPGSSGAKVGTAIGEGASTGAMLGGPGGAALGALFGAVAGAVSVEKAHVAIDLKIVDSETGRVVGASSVKGSPGRGRVDLGIAFDQVAFGGSAFNKTPIGKAVRDCINKGVNFIVKNSYPQAGTGESSARPRSQEIAATPSSQKVSPEPAEDLLTISNCSAANIRKGPDTDYSIIATLKKGTELEKVETSQGWVKIKLDDGRIGWVYGELVE